MNENAPKNKEKDVSTEDIISTSKNKGNINKYLEIERAKMFTSETSYLRALRLRKKLHNPKVIRKEYVEELRNEYDTSRANFANALNESVNIRLDKKEKGKAVSAYDTPNSAHIEDNARKIPYTEEQKEEIKHRYRSMILARDIIDRAHKARIEALGNKERGVFKKSLEWYARTNKHMETKIATVIARQPYENLSKKQKDTVDKHARTIARGLRILTFAGIGGVAGGVAVIGHRIFSSITGAFVGAVAAEKIGKHFMHTKDTERILHLKQVREATAHFSTQNIQELDQAYKISSNDVVENSRRALRVAITAFLIGGGVSYGTALALEQLPSVHEAVNFVPRYNVNKALNPAPHHAVHEHDVIAVSVEKGQSADLLFTNLKQSLQKKYPDSSTAPLIAQHILTSNPHTLSTEYGFAKHNESALLYQDEKIEFTNNSLIFFDKNHIAHTLSHIQDGHIVKGEVFAHFDGRYLLDNPISPAPTATHQIAKNVTEHNTPNVSNSTLHNKESAIVNSSVIKPVPAHTVLPSRSDVNQSIGDTVQSQADIPANDYKWHLISNDKIQPTNIQHAESSASVGAGSETISHITDIHKSIAELLQPQELGNYAKKPIFEILYGNNSIPLKFHNQLVDIVSQSGIGPEDNENLMHFLKRAQESVSAHTSDTLMHITNTHDMQISIYQTHLYESAQKKIIAFGGDFDARSLIAYEYINNHPHAHVLIQGIDKSSTIDLSSVSSYNGRSVIATRIVPLLVSPEHFITRIK